MSVSSIPSEPHLPLEGDIEAEDTSRENVQIKPWDPKHIRITTKNYTLREIFSQIEENELDLAPDFQRSFVWKRSQQVRLIESILLGIPLPAFYFNLDHSGAIQVVDGVQRLTTVKRFMSDELELAGDHLEYLSDLKGLSFSTLDPSTRRRFASTQIVAHVIEPQTPDEVKYDIFNRVNTGGSPLVPQEIRHCMSRAPSREFLRALVESREFDEVTEFAFWTRDRLRRDDRRMTDREMALRFCAFRTVSIEEYSKASSLDSFLLEFTRRIDVEAEKGGAGLNLAELSHAFSQSMVNCLQVLGNAAFRRWPPNAERRGPINRAVFESHALALEAFPLDALLLKRAEIQAAFRGLFDDPTYDAAVRSGTGDPRRLERRLDMPKQLLAKILG
ncbi:hypothetical protein ACVIQT_005965 [Bradyrhizobium diazoefficiens]